MFENAINALFDPAWNTAHGGVIWLLIVGVLYVSGFGLPAPEDIPLMLAGFTAYKQGGDQFVLWRFLLTFAIVTATILLGDLTAYALGARYGMAIRGRVKFFARLLPDSRLQRVQRWFDQYGSFTIFLARQLAGARFVTFYAAGTIRMNIPRFVFWDFIGALVSVPVWLTIGALAARYGRQWMHAASGTVGRYMLLGALAIGLGFGLFLWMRRRRAAAEVAAGAAATPPSTTAVATEAKGDSGATAVSTSSEPEPRAPA